MGYLELAKQILKEIGPKLPPPIPTFDPDERALVKHLPASALESLQRVKRILGGRVVNFKPPVPPRPPSEDELKEQQAQEHLREKCRIRGTLLADLGRILNARKKGRKRSQP